MVFSAGGAEASLEAVARAAGARHRHAVYRHFPTREALFEGRGSPRRCEQLAADPAEQLKQEAKPIDALRQWTRSIVKFVATKKGMSAALTLAVDKNSKLFSSSADRLARTVGGLLDRAIAAGEIRDGTARKICCVPLWACATCTIRLAGRPAFCDLSTVFAHTVCINVAIQGPRLHSAFVPAVLKLL